jgi:hypothetical protein
LKCNKIVATHGVSSSAFCLIQQDTPFPNFSPYTRNEHSSIDLDGDGLANLYPGDNGYTEAVLANYETNIALITEDYQESVFRNQLNGNSLYAPFIVADGNPTDPASFELEEVYFAFTAANADGAVHVKFDNGSLLFEDLPGGGDNDFNDAVIQVQML